MQARLSTGLFLPISVRSLQLPVKLEENGNYAVEAIRGPFVTLFLWNLCWEKIGFVFVF
jgi:hypothetical protein